jgi:dUTP pyrophosphatase
MVPTGLIFDIPKGYSIRVHARSGMSLKQGLVLANSEGVIDSDYVEETFVLIMNVSDNGHWLTPGDRIAQAELVKQEQFKIEERKTRPTVKTDRVGGMGSTGVSMNAETITLTTN